MFGAFINICIYIIYVRACFRMRIRAYTKSLLMIRLHTLTHLSPDCQRNVECHCNEMAQMMKSFQQKKNELLTTNFLCYFNFHAIILSLALNL